MCVKLYCKAHINNILSKFQESRSCVFQLGCDFLTNHHQSTLKNKTISFSKLIFKPKYLFPFSSYCK